MRRKLIPALFISYLFFCSHSASFAEYGAVNISAAQEGRYELATLNNPGIYSKALQRKVPAIVLDTYLGIAYRCLDLQNERPLWIKTDLGKNADKQPVRKKYTVQIPVYSGYELKIPAIVLDIEEGKVWTCPDITSQSANWVERALVAEKERKGINTEP